MRTLSKNDFPRTCSHSTYFSKKNYFVWKRFQTMNLIAKNTGHVSFSDLRRTCWMYSSPHIPAASSSSKKAIIVYLPSNLPKNDNSHPRHDSRNSQIKDSLHSLQTDPACHPVIPRSPDHKHPSKATFSEFPRINDRQQSYSWFPYGRHSC